MKKKVIIFTLVAAMAMQTVACSKITEKNEASQKATTESQETEKEAAQDQAQADADAISEMHANDNQNQEEVEETDFGRVIPYLEESANWKRTESVVAENDVVREVYQCDEQLEFLCESAANDNTDAQTAMGDWVSGKGWTLFSNSKNEELSVSLDTEVYNYEAMHDDNGYSMYHQGVYFIKDGYWYAADFSVMEGESTNYTGIISGYLNSLTLR